MALKSCPKSNKSPNMVTLYSLLTHSYSHHPVRIKVFSHNNRWNNFNSFPATRWRKCSTRWMRTPPSSDASSSKLWQVKILYFSKFGPIPATFSFILSFQCSWQWKVGNIRLRLSGFELRTSGVGSNHSTNWATIKNFAIYMLGMIVIFSYYDSRALNEDCKVFIRVVIVLAHIFWFSGIT